VKTQQLIIIVIGVLAMVTVITTGTDRLTELVIVGLLGFLGQKTLTDKQSEIINETIKGMDIFINALLGF
jgi:hypothetical protein